MRDFRNDFEIIQMIAEVFGTEIITIGVGVAFVCGTAGSPESRIRRSNRRPDRDPSDRAATTRGHATCSARCSRRWVLGAARRSGPAAGSICPVSVAAGDRPGTRGFAIARRDVRVTSDRGWSSAFAWFAAPIGSSGLPIRRIGGQRIGPRPAATMTERKPEKYSASAILRGLGYWEFVRGIERLPIS